MTKPAPPRANTAEVVEIDAMDVMEWQHGQRTPQASDANLAALVKQSARGHESAPVVAAGAAAARVPSLVARARVTEAPPVRPRASEPPMRADRRAASTANPPGVAAVRPSSPPGSAFPAIGTPPPSDQPLPAVPMSVGGYPIYRAPGGSSDEHAALDPSAYRAAPAAYDASQRPDPLAISDLSAAPPGLRGLREGTRPRNRRLLWIAGATGCAAAILAVVVLAGSGDASTATMSEPAAAVSADPTPSPAAATATATATGGAATGASAQPQLSETRPRVPEKITQPATPALAAAATAAPATRPALPSVRSLPARRAVHRLGGKKVVVEYQRRPSDAPVPSLVAQASEDPAIARARSAYLTGNAKLFAGNAPAAIDAYREALGLYPGYVGGYRGLGLAYAQLGNTKQALDALRTYVTAAPNAKDVGLIKKRIARLQSL